MKEVVLLGSYTNTIEKELTLIKNILDWKRYNIPIVLSTHYPVSEKIQNLVDYYIFDKEQHLDPILINQHVYWCSSFRIFANYDRPYHAAAGLISLQNAIRAIGDKFDFVYLQDYDVNLNKDELLKIVRPFQSSPFEMFMFNWNNNPNSYATNVWFFKQGGYNKIWGDIQSVSDYMNLVKLANKNNSLIEHLAKDIIDLRNLHNIIYLFDEDQTKRIMGNFSEHKADIVEPRIYLSSTSDDKAILFLVNESQNTITYKIQIKNRITGQKEELLQDVSGRIGMFWKLFSNGNYVKVSCNNTEKEYYIEPYNTFDECRFEFLDGTKIFMKT